ncbi:MAG: hypothetical protein CL398_01905 [Acidiferrobacteraceae bacterium]|nr:hypothetical protein [Acidiferrobacteraceae bacterium]|tara:strand:- start:747 stop:1874 length:1128 start_codon:yes stop_codon:yes gene_type:complete
MVIKLRRLIGAFMGRIMSRRRFSGAKVVSCNLSANLSPSIETKRAYLSLDPEYCYRGGSVRDWRERARPQLNRLLGMNELSDRKISECHTLWTAEDTRATYEKRALRTSFGEYIPIYVASSKSNPEPKHWLFCLQGHTSGMHITLNFDGDETSQLRGAYKDRNFGLNALENGFGVICLEQMSLGIRSENSVTKRAPHPCFDASMQSLLVGQTLMGRRISDLLLTLSYMRMEKSYAKSWGVMGNSLGGSVGLFASAISDKIDYCIASCCISDFYDSLLDIYHCADLYIPGLAKSFRMGDIVGLNSPKLLVASMGVIDRIFPINGFRKSFTEAQEIYRNSEAPSQLKAVIGMGGHGIYTEEIFALISRSLRPRSTDF